MLRAQSSVTHGELIEALKETRARTLELVDDLNDEQLMGPRLKLVNPQRWEIGHLAWFQEFWLLRHLAKQPAILKHGDELYDSARVAHDTRWDLPLLGRDANLSYMSQVLERVVEHATNGSSNLTDAQGYDQEYFLNLVLLHEQMHGEAIAYTRQTLSYSSPAIRIATVDVPGASKMHRPKQQPTLNQSETYLTGDVEIAGGTFLIGSASEAPFVFDNEQPAYEVEIGPFAISRTAVSNGEFKQFVEDAGYERSELWTAAGWQWRTSVGAEHPVYWHRDGSGWLRRNFDEWVTLDERLPVIHVNWYEADAYCRWARRRLPTEVEWEMAASVEPAEEDRDLTTPKRKYPWGAEPPTVERANLDWRAMGCIPVDALLSGDSAFGCRQMIGNVWEWTASDFKPYPGFVAGPYKDYSAPWFGDHKVLRGGCWVTPSRLINNTYRNFYPPHRRDVWAGLRTCALKA